MACAEYVGSRYTPAPFTTVSTGASRSRALSSCPSASYDATATMTVRTSAWLPGRSPIWAARHTAKRATSRILEGPSNPRDSSLDGSWMTPTAIATDAPASSARISVSSSKVPPVIVTKPIKPNEPTANEASLTTSFVNSRRAISNRRSVSSITHAVEAMPNNSAVVASTPPTGSASSVVMPNTTTTMVTCEWTSARRIPGSNRSSTVSESPSQPLWIELTVTRMPNSSANWPSPRSPSWRSAISCRTRLEPATIACDATAASGRREPRGAAMFLSPIVSSSRGGDRTRRRWSGSAARRGVGAPFRGHGRRCRGRRRARRHRRRSRVRTRRPP